MKKLMMMVAAVAASVALADGAGTPTAKIKSITNRYPWNGKIDVEYEVSNVGSSFDPIDKLVTKFTSEGVEKTAVTDLTEAELKEGKVCRTFDCRELFGEGKRDVQAQSAAKLSPLDYDYAVIDISGGPNTNFYPVSYHKTAPTGGWNVDEYKTSKIVLYYVKAGSYPGNQYQSQQKDQTTTGFWIGMFPVTEAQYVKVMGGSGESMNPQVSVSYETLRGTSDPNVEVTGKSSFLRLLCDRTGLDGFDLPTESQWEIACRAETKTNYFWGENDTTNADQYMWYSGNSGNPRSIQGVGQKLPNAWGLYDMAGNVWEWCRDEHQSKVVFVQSADVSFKSEAGGISRVQRGGAYDSPADNGRSSNRNVSGYSDSLDGNGFRLSRMSSK